MKNKIKWPLGIQKKITPRYLVFIFFLFLSSILWLLTTLNNVYEVDLPIKIRYKNFPEGKVLREELPETLSIRIRSDGFSIIKFKYISNPSPLVDVNSFALNKISKKKPNDFFLITNSVSKQINKQLSHQQEKKVEIKKISPDTLFFKFEDIISKKVAVKPLVDIAFDIQYNLSGKIQSEPDSILVSGGKSIIDTLQYVYTKHIALENIVKTTELESTISPINKVDFSSTIVNLTIPVEQFTEKSIDVPINSINIPDSLSLKIFPRNAKVSFLVSLADYEKVGPMLFTLNVDYKSISESLEEHPERIKVNIAKYPDYIYSPVVKPNTIQFIIEKK